MPWLYVFRETRTQLGHNSAWFNSPVPLVYPFIRAFEQQLLTITGNERRRAVARYIFVCSSSSSDVEDCEGLLAETAQARKKRATRRGTPVGFILTSFRGLLSQIYEVYVIAVSRLNVKIENLLTPPTCYVTINFDGF